MPGSVRRLSSPRTSSPKTPSSGLSTSFSSGVERAFQVFQNASNERKASHRENCATIDTTTQSYSTSEQNETSNLMKTKTLQLPATNGTTSTVTTSTSSHGPASATKLQWQEPTRSEPENTTGCLPPTPTTDDSKVSTQLAVKCQAIVFQYLAGSTGVSLGKGRGRWCAQVTLFRGWHVFDSIFFVV